MTINQIDIGNFGSFKGLSWKKAIKDHGGNIQNFRRLNILYGRNYSGKTTLSRIFRALETGRIPPNYIGSAFTIYGDKGDVTQAGIGAHGYDIRVYNRDFVADNLSFLVDQVSGEIKTFAIVGEKNKEIEDAIAAIETKLGSVEAKVGLRYELELKRKEQDRTKSNHKTASDGLEDKLRSHANDKIKKNREYGTAVYNIDSIKKDIGATKKAGFKVLGTEEQASKLSLLKQEALPDISESVSINLKIDSLKKTAENLLSRTIKPTQPIQELLSDSVLQLWVKQGIPLHKEKRDTCAFCRQALPHDIWQILDSHFSKESFDLESEIDSCLTSVKSEIKAIPNFITLTGDKFYTEERTAFEAEKTALIEALVIYKQDLEALQSALDARKGSLFETIAIPEFSHDSDAIQKHTEAINALITQSNGRTITLGKDQSTAREALRLTDVASFIDTIGYDSEKTRITELKKDADAANSAYMDAEKEITKLEGEVTQLRSGQKDERKGADRVNALLNHFFGHDGIKLEARDNTEKSAIKFEITRDGKSAYNLSEGECSLIAFCYFIAKLEEPDSKDKELIIYIDDPISSLDGNHIFFMFSLIESLIAKPISEQDKSVKYKQLFISTHSLDFLKYLKRLSGRGKGDGNVQQFLISRSQDTSTIQPMPDYLKKYITEFNYLFHQIFRCSKAENAAAHPEAFYSFGNNLRKFLEAYLFYKYPSHEDGIKRLSKFLGNDQIAIALTNRLDNELSHLEEVFDRSVKPMDIPEITTLANFLLNKLFETDKDQYNSLLRSIGEPERTQ